MSLMAFMAFLSLTWLLFLNSHGSGLVGGEPVATTGDQHPDGDTVAGDRTSSSSKTSSCRPLDGFVRCYDVVSIVPVPTQQVSNVTELAVSFRALGRPFSLRLHVDAVAGETEWLTPLMSWSWVMSSSAVVQVVGDYGNVTYGRNDLNINWYVGYDRREVSPSAVLASVVEFSDQRLFRAVIYTTDDIYYVEPALDHSAVKRSVGLVAQQGRPSLSTKCAMDNFGGIY